MKTLFLLRHAKSDWSDINILDYNRPLNKRGTRDALLMFKLLKNRVLEMDAIYSSTALRAKQTTDCVIKDLNFNKDRVYWQKEIYDYHYEPKKLAQLLLNFDDNYNSVMIVGHNPGISSLIEYFTGDISTNMPTCSIAKLELHINSWKEISRGCGSLIFFEYPKKYKKK
jgi:phosphohistidine phosphatase